MFKRNRRPFARFAPLALIAIGLIVTPSASTHPADPAAGIAPHWSCRASAGYANVVGNGSSGHVEPGAANGNATTGADSDQCQTDDALFPQPTVQFPPGGGDDGGATENAPLAQTRIVNDFTYKQAPTSAAGVDQVTLAGQGHSLSAQVVRADAGGRCQNGQPVLTGTSKVADLIVDGKPQNVDDGMRHEVVNNSNIVVVANEQTVGPDKPNGGKQLIQR